MNGISWASGPEARVLAKPERGAVEVWELENSSGGWTHPIPIHLVDFQILSRSGGERKDVLPYEKIALKDVVWLNKGETVRVLARYYDHKIAHSTMSLTLSIFMLHGMVFTCSIVTI